ncbi:MAG: hypothetical protein IKS96_02760 [Fibrobacter sp.]|nr:hypothetical protein [Bacteroidaceae bacterium]MBR6448864.1 hypothetical protein [Fibrobacter sp.]
MSNIKVDDFATKMFKKGSNTVELVFAERYNRMSVGDRKIELEENTLLHLMLYSYLLGSLACILDQTAFIELSQAIDRIWK